MLLSLYSFERARGGDRGSSSGDFDINLEGCSSVRASQLRCWWPGEHVFPFFQLLALVGLAFRGGLMFTKIIGIPPKF